MGKFDGILDDVIVNAKAAASVVSKKASDVYDNSKQKIVAAEIRAEINTKLKENLDLINDSISATKSVTYCPECGSDVPENSKFCNSCGAKLDEDKAQL